GLSQREVRRAPGRSSPPLEMMRERDWRRVFDLQRRARAPVGERALGRPGSGERPRARDKDGLQGARPDRLRGRPLVRRGPRQLQRDAPERPACAAGNAAAAPPRRPPSARLADDGLLAASGTVKAALRRAYAKAGVSNLPAHAKRRALCRIARERGWI